MTCGATGIALGRSWLCSATSASPAALDTPALGQSVTARIQKAPDDRNPVGAGREGAIAGDARLAVLGAGLGVQRERDVEAVGRQETGGAIRPFQQHHRLLGQIVEA